MCWDWWLGGLGLAFVAIGYHLTLGKTFGFSGMWERVLFKSETDALSEANSMADDEDAFMAAMLAATAEAQGDDANFEIPDIPESNAKTEIDPHGWLGSLTFVICVLVGGLIAALTSGNFEWRMDLGDVHTGFFSAGPLNLTVLLLGGLCVGFGTRMAGGCTSGHGLNGCGRLQIPSIVATATFFGTGVAVSWLMETLL